MHAFGVEVRYAPSTTPIPHNILIQQNISYKSKEYLDRVSKNKTFAEFRVYHFAILVTNQKLESNQHIEVTLIYDY